MKSVMHTGAGFPDRRRQRQVRRLMTSGVILVLIALAGVIGLVAHRHPARPTAHRAVGAPTKPVATSNAATNSKLAVQIANFEQAYWSNSYRQNAATRVTALADYVAPSFMDHQAPSNLGVNQAQLAASSAHMTVQASVNADAVKIVWLSASSVVAQTQVVTVQTDKSQTKSTRDLTDTSYWSNTGTGWRVTSNDNGEGTDGP